MDFFEIYGPQKTLTQWDVGRKLIVNGQCGSVHFANSSTNEAMVCAVTEEEGVPTARIPDEMLQTSGILWAYGFVDAEEGYTKISQAFVVLERQKPGDYVYVPTQVKTWEELEERIGELEAREETDPTVPDWAKQAKKPAYTATEVGARESTWLPTPAEIGAAPAGYGLGTNDFKTETVKGNLDNYKTCGWVRYYNASDSLVAGMNLLYALIRVDSFSNGGEVLQTAFAAYNSTLQGCTLQRHCINAVWGEWEWVNPPMVIGTEYRTVERYNGKTVFAKWVSCGTMPATSTKVINGVLNAAYTVCDIRGIGTNSGGSVVQLPAISDAKDVLARVSVLNGISLYIATFTDMSGYSLNVLLKYIKD